MDTELLTKSQAAALLGVSVATFDRRRSGLGLRPVKLVRVKPIQFSRVEVELVKSGKRLPTGYANGKPAKLVTLKTLKRTKGGAS